ncbi:hypothetical protein Tco_1189852, partial [Tanacetum coccineum]
INVGIQQHLQKAYYTNKAAFKGQHWVIDPTTGTYNLEKIRRACPEDITVKECVCTEAELRHSGEEMRRMEAIGTYIDDEINRLARRGKKQGHIPGVGRVLPARATASPIWPAGVAGAGTMRRVPTIRRMRMRMAMAIVSYVIYGLVCYIVTLC